MRRMGIAALALGFAAPAHAEVVVDGVWRGTIGTLPVHVCLAAAGERGSYFYLSKKVPIALTGTAGATRWTEKGDGGAEANWVLSAPSGSRMTGSWTGGGKTLPIALSRVPMGDDGELDGPCQSDAFMAPRLTAPKVVARPMHAARLSYTRLDYDVGKQFKDVQITSFQIAPTRPGDKAINAALRAMLTSGYGSADYAGCMKGSLGLSGSDGDLAMVAEPSFVSDEWVVAETTESGFCGGAHPFAGRSHTTFDRRTGKEVELGRWLAPKGMTVSYDAAARFTDRKIGAALRKLVLAQMPAHPDAECTDVRAEANYWDMALTRTGIAFEPSLGHAVRACGDVATVPFAKLVPFLSPAGKAGLARMKAAVQLP